MGWKVASQLTVIIHQQEYIPQRCTTTTLYLSIKAHLSCTAPGYSLIPAAAERRRSVQHSARDDVSPTAYLNATIGGIEASRIQVSCLQSSRHELLSTQVSPADALSSWVASYALTRRKYYSQSRSPGPVTNCSSSSVAAIFFPAAELFEQVRGRNSIWYYVCLSLV